MMVNADCGVPYLLDQSPLLVSHGSRIVAAPPIVFEEIGAAAGRGSTHFQLLACMI